MKRPRKGKAINRAFNRMDIYSPAGTKVRFDAQGGHDFEKEAASKWLVLGELYTIRYCNVDSSHTDVCIEEEPKHLYNSCLFAAIKRERGERPTPISD